MNKTDIQQILNEYLEENPHLFLVELNISPSQEIEVLMDSDKGITIQECKMISRKVEAYTDLHEIDASIMVASPGVDYPLKSYRQFKKNLNRKLKVQLAGDSKAIEGTLVDVTEENITLYWKERVNKEIGKGKVTVERNENYPLEEIVKANVVLSFK